MNKENTKLDIALQSDRSEEVADIIERMPNKFGLAITGIVIFIFLLMAFFGFISRYPDIVHGQIVVSTHNAPIKLIATVSGKLKLNGIKSMNDVRENQIIAYIENSTNPYAVDSITRMLKYYNPTTDNIEMISKHIPKNFSLGELNIKYYAFVNAIQQYRNYRQDKAFDKQKEGLLAILAEQQKTINGLHNQLFMAQNSLNFVYKFYKRDSTLFKKRVISEAELDKTEMSYLSAKDKVQQETNAIISARQDARQTQSQLQQLHIEDPEKEKELHISLISTYNDLLDNIKIWEQKYVFRAPFAGKLQFLKFYNNNQFVQSGDAVFTVLPVNDKPFGQVTLPSSGAGKVKVDQEVIVKLDNYPYLEYGSVTGRIKNISLTTNTEKTEKGEVDNYLVTVEFPNGLKTNYGSVIGFRYESKGSAEIITNQRKLIERLFDNLEYAVKK
ncbi:HlyD family secretion protein [Pedobacter borealis]|uniref:HlyD family secretion protein n=1 Tax=Pedobacter borealis TaxID=475254 RepID=UPI0004932F38|nr:HlyD family efflux transporter periplasmic adaptor subunit [Pedobacter borealis]